MREFKDKGFSLVELIVVIAIMAVLVGVIAPQFLGYVERSKLAVDQSNVSMLNDITNVYYTSAGDSNPFKDETKSNAELMEALLASGYLTASVETKSEYAAFLWTFDEEEWYLDGPTSLDRIDTSGNGKVTIAEAKAAGYSMPVYSTSWLYKYMTDGNHNGMVGE